MSEMGSEINLNEARSVWTKLGLTIEEIAQLEAEAVAETGGDPDPAEAAAQTGEARRQTHSWIERGEAELRERGVVTMTESTPRKGKEEQSRWP